MMAGNPNRWSMHPPSQFQPSAFFSSSSPSLFSSQYVIGSSSSSSSSSFSLPFNFLPDSQELPHQSWSQLLLGGLSGEEEEERYGPSHFQHKKVENWEDQILNQPSHSRVSSVVGGVKQEVPQNSNNLYGGHGDEEFQPPSATARPTLSHSHHHHQVLPVSSPRSCVTSLSSNILDFSYNNNNKKKNNNKPDGRNQHPDQSSECNSTATGGVCKKARVQATSSQPPLKVRKEKLGDRITALHQLVSPFGKTDTASVLLEAIGYIRFLQGQIEALSSPYLSAASSNMRNRHSVQGERNSVFPEDPGQLLNDICLKRKGCPNLQDGQDKPKDLRSRGLCLVPVSCTQHVGSENGADYWAPAIGGGF